MSSSFEQIHMPAILAAYLEKERRGGALKKVWDRTFGTTWLVQSVEGAELTERGWSRGDEWFHDIPPSLFQWATCFPSPSDAQCIALIGCWDEDQSKNEERLLDYKKRCLQTESDPPLELRVRYIAEQWGHATPDKGWIPAFVPSGQIQLEATAEQRETYQLLRLSFEHFRQKAEKLTSDAKGVGRRLNITEIFLPWGRETILAIGHHGDGYASFIVGQDLTPHLDQFD